MEIVNKTFRIFVSSTFSDLKEERNALQRDVFPRLRELCMQHGYRFQAIDLRWGVRDESGQDQQTMNICLQEVARCQRPPNPNFIILLGDRYGWQPLPTEIPEKEFKLIEKQLKDKTDKALVHSWYREDTNAVTPDSEYCLQPKNKKWKEEEPLLREILREAIDNIPQESFTEAQRLKYFTSATEQEIQAGALNVTDAKEHVFAYFREFETIPEPKDENANDYIDLKPNGSKKQHDTDAHNKLNDLKDKLNKKISAHNISTYKAEWKKNRVTKKNIDKLCEDVYNNLSKIIEKEIDLIEDKPALEQEIATHKAFAKDRSEVFVGREEILTDIQNYIGGSVKQLLAIHGISGTGKSALMAYSLKQTIKEYPEAKVIYRFIGVTPDSSNGRSLLESLCHQISRDYKTDEFDIPSDYKELIDEFPKRLALATGEKPLVLYLDALDQLSETDNAKNLSWLPEALPENVRLVVTTLPGECYKALQGKVPENRILELQPMAPIEGKQLLDKWLENAKPKRKLEKHQTAEILHHFSHKDNGSPLYLKLAFEESRKWKSYTREENTKLSPDIQGIINDLFTRLSSNENHGEMMVSRSLGYLAAAKNGLSEDELMDVLSNDLELYGRFLMEGHHIPEDVMVFLKDYIHKYHRIEVHNDEGNREKISDKNATTWFNNELKKDKDKLKAFLKSAYKESQVNKDFHFFRLPIVLWSRLYFDLEPYLSEKSADGTSLLTFYHTTSFESKVKGKYMSGKKKTHLHKKLAKYFVTQKNENHEQNKSVTNFRKLSELSFHLVHSQMWDGYKKVLTDFNFIETKLRSVGPFDMIKDFQEGQNHGFSPDWLIKIRKSIEMSFQILVQDPGQIPGQLLARLLSYDTIEINHLLKKAKEYKLRPWLEPLIPSLTQSGTSLFQAMTLHSRAVLSLNTDQRMEVMISGGADGTIVLTDMKNWDTIKSISLSCDLEGVNQKVLEQIWNKAFGEFKPAINSVAISSDKKYVVFSVFPSKYVYVWNLQYNVLESVLKGHLSYVKKVIITPDSKTIISGGMDGILNLWPLGSANKSKSIYHQFTTHSDEILTITLTKNGKFLLSGSKDSTIQIWDLRKLKKVNKISTGGPVLDMTLINQDSTVLSISGDHKIKGWSVFKRISFLKDLFGKGSIQVIKTKKKLASIKASTDSSFILTTSKTSINGIQTETNQHFKVADVPEKINSFLLTPDDKYVITGSTDGRVKLWDFNKNSEQQLNPHTGPIRCVALSDDGHIGATGSADKTIGVWNISEKKMVGRLIGHTGDIMALSISDDKKFIISGSKDHTVRIWDIKTEKEIHRLEGHNNMIMNVELIRNGDYILSGAKDNTVRIWDMKTGSRIEPILSLNDRILAMKSNSDGTLIFVATRGYIYFWSLVWSETRNIGKQNKSIILTSKKLFPLCKINKFVIAIDIIDNGKSLFSIDIGGKMSQWNILKKQLIRELQVDSGVVYGLTISNKQNPIMLTAEGKKLRVRNLISWETLAVFDGDNEFFCCALSKEGDCVIAGDGAGRMHIFHLHIKDSHGFTLGDENRDTPG